jgi:PAS domain S-box-containing protein
MILVTAYLILFASPGHRLNTYSYLFMGAYLASNLFIPYIPAHFFYKAAFFYFLVLFDSIMVITGIYLSGNVGTDFYLVFFLIICLSALGSNLRYLMVTTLLLCGIYGWLLYQEGLLSGTESISHALRLPFIVIVALFFGFIVDVIVRDKDKKIRESEERYKTLVQSSAVLVAIVDIEGRLLSANNKMLSTYGFHAEEQMVGKNISEFHSHKNSAEFLSHVQKVIGHDTISEYEFYERLFDKWFFITISPIKDSEGQIALASVVAKDITVRVKKEEELKETNQKLIETRDQLIQKDKMAALGRMASGIAHEFRNPLEIISMGVDYIENAFHDSNEMAKKSFEKIYNAIDRANKIINDILKFSRKTEFKLEPVVVPELLTETLSLAKHHIKKSNICLNANFPDVTAIALVDRNMLQQVVLNIINNAVDAMSDRPVKELSVSVRRESITKIGYKIGYRQTDYFKIGDEMIVVEIGDTGMGIPEDVLPKIFEPFFTTKETGKGTGLGLSLAHMIIERLRGVIDVQSEINKGTVFYIKLQPADADEAK